MTTAKPPPGTAPFGRASGRLCSVELHHHWEHDHEMMIALDRLYESECAALSLDHLRVSQVQAGLSNGSTILMLGQTVIWAYTWLMGSA